MKTLLLIAFAPAILIAYFLAADYQYRIRR